MNTDYKQNFKISALISVNLWLNSYKSRRAGFTLIEVLLSITLLIIILGAVYTSFFTVQSALERFDDISLKYHEIRTALDFMRREIEGAFLPEHRTQPATSSVESNAELKTHFVIEDRDIFGKPASRLYLTTFSFKGSGINIISYYLQVRNESPKKDNGLTLVKIESPVSMALTDKTLTENLPSKAYISEVVEGIEGFTVETLFNNKWVKTWDTKQTGGLPEIVRVSIEFDDKGKKVKLTEYARLRVGKQL
jgi:general secretion pathway protein J